LLTLLLQMLFWGLLFDIKGGLTLVSNRLLVESLLFLGISLVLLQSFIFWGSRKGQNLDFKWEMAGNLLVPGFGQACRGQLGWGMTLNLAILLSCGVENAIFGSFSARCPGLIIDSSYPFQEFLLWGVLSKAGILFFLACGWAWLPLYGLAIWDHLLRWRDKALDPLAIASFNLLVPGLLQAYTGNFGLLVIFFSGSIIINVIVLAAMAM